MLKPMWRKPKLPCACRKPPVNARQISPSAIGPAASTKSKYVSDPVREPRNSRTLIPIST